MVEIRTIRQDEAESFLRLLCEVFDLDFTRAQSIFFNEPMFDLRRKWALFERGHMTSILTTVPLEFGWGKAIGIAGVATRDDRRGRGLAEQLLMAALEASEAQEEKAAFLFARQTGLYERCGFQSMDRVVRAPIRTRGDGITAEALGVDEVIALYDAWSAGNPNRLRRDGRRWNYWKWNFKMCLPFSGGYLCPEGSLVRECLTNELLEEWPVPKGTNWFGLSTMAAQMGVPIVGSESELILMGRHAPGTPQMFMTDQF